MGCRAPEGLTTNVCLVAWSRLVLSLTAAQIDQFETQQMQRFGRVVWEIWASTEGPRFPALPEAEGLRVIASCARFCDDSAYDDTLLVVRASLYALLATAQGHDPRFVWDMLVFLVNRELPDEEAFTWVEHVLAEQGHERR